MSRFAADTRTEAGQINEPVGEAWVSGQSCTVTNVSVNLRPNTRLVPVLPNRCAVLEGGRTTKEVLEREARRAWDTLAKEKVGDPRLPVLDKAMVNFSLYTWWKLP